MEIIIIAVLILLLVVLVFLGYKLLRFMFKSKGHTVVSLSLCVLGLLIMGSYHVFFKKMEFVPSKVYPDLYLIKNPFKNKNELDTAIKEFVIDHVEEKFSGLNDSTKGVAPSTYSLRFYEYTRSWSIHLFADAGTAYFLENEEDPSGFVVEELSMYSAYRLAQFHGDLCENDPGQYCGELIFFDNGEVSNYLIMKDITLDQFKDPQAK